MLTTHPHFLCIGKSGTGVINCARGYKNGIMHGFGSYSNVTGENDYLFK